MISHGYSATSVQTFVELLWTEYQDVFNGEPEPRVKYQCPQKSFINNLR